MRAEAVVNRLDESQFCSTALLAILYRSGPRFDLYFPAGKRLRKGKPAAVTASVYSTVFMKRRNLASIMGSLPPKTATKSAKRC